MPGPCRIAARRRNDLTYDERSNQLVACGCRDCRDCLVRFNAAMTEKLLAARPVAGYARDELRQEAAIALMRSADRWPGRGNFTPYYVTTLRNHLAMLARAQRAAMRRPPHGSVLSLEAESEGGRSILDRIVDPADVVTIVDARLRLLSRAPDMTRHEKRRSHA